MVCGNVVSPHLLPIVGVVLLFIAVREVIVLCAENISNNFVLFEFFCHQPRDALATGRPDVLPGGRESLDASGGHVATTPQHWAEPPVRRKESVAKMTFGGLAYTLAVSLNCALTTVHHLCFPTVQLG